MLIVNAGSDDDRDGVISMFLPFSPRKIFPCIFFDCDMGGEVRSGGENERVQNKRPTRLCLYASTSWPRDLGHQNLKLSPHSAGDIVSIITHT